MLHVLQATCLAATQHEGIWPNELAATAEHERLNYLKPKNTPGGVPGWRLACTVVLHESLIDYPRGVWVGFADAHMEFAHNQTELNADLNEPDIARRIMAIRDAESTATSRPPSTTRPAKQLGELTIKVVDTDGLPVVSAMVGQWGSFGDVFFGQPMTRLLRGVPPRLEEVIESTSRDGLATVQGSDVFGHAWDRRMSMPLFIIDGPDKLMALEPVLQTEFGSGHIHLVQLKPQCHVRGEISSLELRAYRQTVAHTVCYPLFEAGTFDVNSLESFTNGPYFDLTLPPGDYDFWVYGTDVLAAHHYARIADGQRELHMQIDLEPGRAFSPRQPQPAPPFHDVAGWENSAPLSLADLRGKVVILDFWGYWCGYCTASMPQLMSLYDEFHNQGLEVIALHDNSVESIDEMNRKLAITKIKEWAGRDLPFPIALDGPKGKNVADYRVTEFPTTLVIDRQGRIIGNLNLENPAARDELRTILTKK